MLYTCTNVGDPEKVVEKMQVNLGQRFTIQLLPLETA